MLILCVRCLSRELLLKPSHCALVCWSTHRWRVSHRWRPAHTHSSMSCANQTPVSPTGENFPSSSTLALWVSWTDRTATYFQLQPSFLLRLYILHTSVSEQRGRVSKSSELAYLNLPTMLLRNWNVLHRKQLNVTVKWCVNCNKSASGASTNVWAVMSA